MPQKSLTSCLTKTLVIVESPSKCKKIEGYLGPGHKCVASFGHLRELISLSNIDIQNDFSPIFTNIEEKKRQIQLLETEIKRTDKVILATDDDREGEAIAWHICALFGLDVERTERIVFHEITESAIKYAVQHPRRINMNLVYAQQTRQVLDLLVGFSLSPILWKHIANQNLSAGRCQTPALKLVYENQQEIERNPGKMVYQTTGYFQLPKCGESHRVFEFELNRVFEEGNSVVEFLEKMTSCISLNTQSCETINQYECSEPKHVEKQPPTPLTTSRLQQLSSNELHYSPKETMRLCQSLYEAGHITYMRTDSSLYSAEFLSDASSYIRETYDDSYVSKDIHTLSLSPSINNGESQNQIKDINKNNNESGPHEAIRPTHLSLTDTVEMDGKERRMYKLIWKTALESCMSPAIFHSIKATISNSMDRDNHSFIKHAEQMKFAGWMIIDMGVSEKIKSNPDFQFLLNQKAQQSRAVIIQRIYSKQVLKESKSHYTEAKLVQLLEKNGIGRPSTFSSLVDKIQDRKYVLKQDISKRKIECVDYEVSFEKSENGTTIPDADIFEIATEREIHGERGKLVIQPLGIMVMDFLNTHFSSLFEYQYTSQMETRLDEIAKGSANRKDVCQECYHDIQRAISSLKSASQQTNGENKPEKYKPTKIEIQIDTFHTFIIGKYGPVIKHRNPDNGKISFKPIKMRENETLDYRKLERGEYSLEDLCGDNDTLPNPNTICVGKKEKSVSSGINIGIYEGHPVFLKKGKYGLYAAWGEKTKSLKSLGNRPVENITFEEVLQQMKYNKNDERTKE